MGGLASCVQQTLLAQHASQHALRTQAEHHEQASCPVANGFNMKADLLLQARLAERTQRNLFMSCEIS